MLVVEMSFLVGSFHATPWDRQVNEGVVEWPPSPWRILRALISTWYHKASSDLDEETVRNLIVKLSGLPKFHLPSATLGHTRHYMPLYRSSLDGKTAKVFDTFARIDADRPLYIVWPEVILTEDEKRALDLLLSRLGYFGRAESWVSAHVADNCGKVVNSIPLGEGETPQPGQEAIRTLACMPPKAYSQWREKTLTEHKDRRLVELRVHAKEKGKSEDKVKLSKKDLDAIECDLPADLFLALHADTGELKSKGWSQPPGSEWVQYTKPKNAFDVMPRAGVGKTMGDEGIPTVARYAVASQATPRLTVIISLAERIHVSLVSRSKGSSVFTGCDESGKPSQGHRHAYIFCESNLCLGKGRRGEITHVTIYAPAGFGRKERLALDGLTKVWGHGGHDIQLILLGVGRPEDFAGIEVEKDACPFLCKSRVWVSRTPFVPTRHAKATRAGVPKLDRNGMQIGCPVHDLCRLLELGGFPRPKKVEPVPSTNLAGRETRWLEFMCERRNGNGKKSTNMGYGFRLEFAEPVKGPIALGYGAHFGLGLFVPVIEDQKSEDP
jgi:CRISPR-associated protein Csb2